MTVKELEKLDYDEFSELAEAFADFCGEVGYLGPYHYLMEARKGKLPKDDLYEEFVEFVADKF